MIQGIDILKKYIGHTIENGLVQSYHHNGIPFMDVSMTYLKFHNWISICWGESTLTISEIADQPQEPEGWINQDNSYDRFPLLDIKEEYPQFEMLLYKPLIKTSQLIYSKNEVEYTAGIKLYFEDELSFMIYTDLTDTFSYYSFDNTTLWSLKEKDI